MDIKDVVRDLKQDVRDMRDSVAEVQADIVHIKADLRHHIKRTDDLQLLAEEFKRYKWTVLGAIIVLAPFANRLVELIFK